MVKHEAGTKQFVTCALGEFLPLEALDLIAVTLMDGTRTDEELLRDCANCCANDGRGRRSLEDSSERIAAAVAKFARWGLLDRTDESR